MVRVSRIITNVFSLRSGRAWLGDYIKNLCQALETLILGGDLYLNDIVKKDARPAKGKVSIYSITDNIIL